MISYGIILIGTALDLGRSAYSIRFGPLYLVPDRIVR